MLLVVPLFVIMMQCQDGNTFFLAQPMVLHMLFVGILSLTITTYFYYYASSAGGHAMERTLQPLAWPLQVERSSHNGGEMQGHV